MLFFPAGTLLSLGKLIKEALPSPPPPPFFFHLLEVGRHSSSLLLTSVHQIAPRKKEPQQTHTVSPATHHVLWSPARVQFAKKKKKWNKDYLGSFMGITFAQMSVLQGVSSRQRFHVTVRHHFGAAESASGRKKKHFSL